MARFLADGTVLRFSQGSQFMWKNPEAVTEMRLLGLESARINKAFNLRYLHEVHFIP
jgi:hypothetical protein